MIKPVPVTETFLVGPCPRGPWDVRRIRWAGATAVLSLQTDADLAELGRSWPVLRGWYRRRRLTPYRVAITDHDDDDLAARLPAATSILSRWVELGHRIYVHCTAGQQRSPAVIIAYLAWYDGLPLDDAIARVREAHACDPPLDVLRNTPPRLRWGDSPGAQ